MAGHFPFAHSRGTRYGRAPRMAINGFFENHGLSGELQERYYKWWYDWAKAFVENDPDLSVTKGVAFNSYPLGQHAHHGFHLNEKYWSEAMADLGAFIRDLIFPKMSAEALHELETQHEAMLEALKAETDQSPRTPAPDVGYFRHT